MREHPTLEEAIDQVMGQERRSDARVKELEEALREIPCTCLLDGNPKTGLECEGCRITRRALAGEGDPHPSSLMGSVDRAGKRESDG